MKHTNLWNAGPLFFALLIASCGGGSSDSSLRVSDTSQAPPTPNQTPPISDDSPNALGTIDSVVLVEGTSLVQLAVVTDGSTLNIDELPENFNFVANPSNEGATGSIGIEISGCASVDRTENVPPYTIQVESQGFESENFSGSTQETCSIALTPYELDNEGGEAGQTLNISVTVMSNGTSPSVSVPPVDPSAPVIDLIGSQTVFLSLGALYNELGATAVDPQDGDVSNNIVIGGDQVNTLIAAAYLITYAVTDSSGITATAIRNVVVQGNQPPQISILGNETTFVALDQPYSDSGAEASDEEDGDLTNQIVVQSNVDTTTEGEYQVSYQVADSSGTESQAIRTVIVTGGQASDEIEADIRSLTRVNGISPETVYFSAEDSICSTCTDLWGLNTGLADAYSSLAYHFEFDDSDSGVFATTGNSRNSQVSSSPRAAHTFECTGPNDPNWDPSDRRCEFDVGVRVQAIDGDYDDAFIRVNIQAQYGVGGYYSDEDIYCVSSDSDYSDCPHSDSGRHLRDTPALGNDNFANSLVLYDQNGATYRDICVGADEQHVRIDTYNSGPRPVVGNVILSGRPGSNCVPSYASNNNISSLSGNMIERDQNGHLVDGFGFDQVVSGLKIGEIDNGVTFALIGYHDIDMDWEDSGEYSGNIGIVTGADGCIEDAQLSCSNIHYPYAFSLTDSVTKANSNNLPLVNIGCFNGCSMVNSVIMGVEANRAIEHNLRVMGAWGLLLSNNWLRGNHVGPAGPKHRATIRAASSGIQADLQKDPENISSGGHIRGSSDSAEFVNHFINAVHNIFNQSAADQDNNHDSASWMHILTQYGSIDGNTFIGDGGESGGRQTFLSGRYIVTRNPIWADGDINRHCGIDTNFHNDNSNYNRSSTIYFDAEPRCNTINNFNYNTPLLFPPGVPGG